MKRTLVLTIFLCSLLNADINVPAIADNATKPVITSFLMSPDSVDTALGPTQVNFDLTVSNSTGISSTSARVTLSDGASNTLNTSISRTDVPSQLSLATVKFHGSVLIPSNFPSGVYSATVAPIIGLNGDGTAGFSSEPGYAKSASVVVGAEDSLSVRSNGFLNYKYPTFVGPAYNKSLGKIFSKSQYNQVVDPIFKVGEKFIPSDYYELSVPTLKLKIRTTTSSVCTTDGTIMNFLSVGSCSFTVYTEQTNDYQLYQDNQVVVITAARTKPVYSVGSIPTQPSTNLPLSVAGPFVYGPFGILTPLSLTPTVCYPIGTYLTIISGGTCALNYSSPASSNFLASDNYPLTFEISRSSQEIYFTLPKKVSIQDKLILLSSTASSKLPVTFKVQPATTCGLDGNQLRLMKPGICDVSALQSGSPTVAPASLTQTILITSPTPVTKNLLCTKAGLRKSFAAVKCPKGYKLEK